VVTLYLTPVVYLYFEQAQDWFRRRRMSEEAVVAQV